MFAANETTSRTIARILHILSANPEAQKRLRDEILAATNDGTEQLDYDQLNDLPYLDAVMRETLRVYALISAPHLLTHAGMRR